MTVDIRAVSILSDDAQALISLLDQELQVEYAPEHVHPVDFDSFHPDGGVFVVGYDEGKPIACGGLRPLNETEVELKRMFVIEAQRGRGVSRAVLRFLEDQARRLGFETLVLETGDAQDAAIGLYSTAGFDRVESFGEYAAGVRSVCFAKRL